jgi:hypothetical protein
MGDSPLPPLRQGSIQIIGPDRLGASIFQFQTSGSGAQDPSELSTSSHAFAFLSVPVLLKPRLLFSTRVRDSFDYRVDAVSDDDPSVLARYESGLNIVLRLGVVNPNPRLIKTVSRDNTCQL